MKARGVDGMSNKTRIVIIVALILVIVAVRLYGAHGSPADKNMKGSK